MKQNRTWLILALLVLSALAPAAAQYPRCDLLCNCDSPCTQKCRFGPSNINCGQWGSCVDLCTRAASPVEGAIATPAEPVCGEPAAPGAVFRATYGEPLACSEAWQASTCEIR